MGSQKGCKERIIQEKIKEVVSKSLGNKKNTTLATLGHVSSEKHKMNEQMYDFGLVDEAAQSSEHDTICAVVRLLITGSLCLAGDHQQLPPFSRNNKTKEHTRLSMMERLYSLHVTCVLLDTQYRMHESIAAWPSFYFYEGKIQTPDHLRNVRQLPKGIEWPNPKIPIYIIPALMTWLVHLVGISPN